MLPERSLPPLPKEFGNPVLRGFHEIVPSNEIDWFPSAPGWKVIAVAATVIATYKAQRAVRRFWRNRYRREALRRLSALRHADVSPSKINEVLKITAMVASDRTEVAALTGVAWCRWLDQRAPDVLSTTSLRCLGDAQYNPESLGSIDTATLLEEAMLWIQRHRDDHAIR